MTFRQTRLGREILFRIENVNRGGAWRVFDVQNAARQRFIEKPGSADSFARRRSPNYVLDLALRKYFESPFQHQEIDGLVAERECKLVSERIAGPIALVEHPPGVILAAASADVLVRDASGAANRCSYAKRFCKGCQSGEPRTVGNCFLLKDCH